MDREQRSSGRFAGGKGSAGNRSRDARHRFDRRVGGAGNGGVAALLESAHIPVTGDNTGEAREERREEQQQLHAKTR